MGITDKNGPDEAMDAAFERLLLNSARSDGPSGAATREAWLKFASTTGALAAVIAGAGATQGVLFRAARSASLKWLAIGAIGGSALTATWLGAQRSSPTAFVPPPSSGVALVPSSELAQRDGTPTVPATPASTQTPSSSREEAAAREPASQALGLSGSARHPRAVAARSQRDGQLARKGAVRSPPGADHERAPYGEASLLAAEVAALDAVRAAISAGNAHQALGLVDAYHRDFPEGQLAPDAEALAIEALETQEERTEMARRAAQFLSRYPNDPHAPRIRLLAETK
jgi:hypothetical protein